jgi:phosphotransacetylase
LAQERGVARCVLVGDEEQIRLLAGQSAVNIEVMELVHEPTEDGAIRRALALCREHQVDVLIDGGVSRRCLFSAIVDPVTGLRAEGWMSGVSVVELESVDRLILLSDGLLTVTPDLGRRIAIVQNAIHGAHRLGIELPRVALLAATEVVDPQSQVSMDAAYITMMYRRKQIKGAIIDGPLGFDNAISQRAAAVKGIDSDVSGRVDVLIAPDLQSAHLLLKTMTCLCRGQATNVIVGGQVPLVLLEPGDDEQRQLIATALGVLLA